MNDILTFQVQLNKAFAQRYGQCLEWNEDGFTLEKLYKIAGKEDRVVNLSFRKDSLSEGIWGDSVTCRFLYTERERINLIESIKCGGSTYGKVRAEYLLFDFNDEQIERLEIDGFDSRDVIEVLVAPLLNENNVYKGDKTRKLNQLDIQVDSDSPLEEMKFKLGVLCTFMEHGMLLTPSEYVDFLALRLVFGAKLDEDERSIVFNNEGKIHNYDVSRRYLYYKSRLRELPEKNKNQQAQMELIRIDERLTFLDSKLREMGTNLEKLKEEKPSTYESIVRKVICFNETRLNPTGHYPIYLTYEGYIHIGLRHIKEWQIRRGDKGQVPLSPVPLSPRLWLLESLNQSSANSCKSL